MPELNDAASREFSLLLEVRDLILAYGWNSTSYQIINPGIGYWLSAEKTAVAGFVSCSGARVVVGAPICAESSLPEVVTEFESDAAQSNEQVCYLAAESRLESIYAKRPKYAKVF